MSYSLKNLESLIKEFSSKSNVNHKRSLNEKIQLLDTIQIKTITLPNFGTFDLNTIQICMIACLTEFYFGNKQLVENIINRIYNTDIYNQNSQISLAASLDYSLKNINRITESKNLTKEKAIRFLDLCIKSNLIDKKNYTINVETIKKIPSLQVEQSFGYLLEVFLNFSIKESNFIVEDDLLHIESVCNTKFVKYVVSILSVLYIYNSRNLHHFFKENNSTFIAEKANRIYKEKLDKDKLELGISNLVDEKIRNSGNIKFEFQYEGQNKDNSIDLVVKYNNKLVAMLDIKSSYGQSCKEVEISSNKNNVNNQISKEMKTSGKENIDKKIIYPNFNIGIIRVAYEFNNDYIKINDYNCIYTQYFDTMSGHQAMMSNKYTKGDKAGEIKEKYEMIDKYYSVSNNNNFAIKKIDDYKHEVLETFDRNPQFHVDAILRKISKSNNENNAKERIRKHTDQDNWKSLEEHQRKEVIKKFKELKNNYKYNNIIQYDELIRYIEFQFDSVDKYKKYNEKDLNNIIESIILLLKNKDMRRTEKSDKIRKQVQHNKSKGNEEEILKSIINFNNEFKNNISIDEYSIYQYHIDKTINDLEYNIKKRNESQHEVLIDKIKDRIFNKDNIKEKYIKNGIRKLIQTREFSEYYKSNIEEIQEAIKNLESFKNNLEKNSKEINYTTFAIMQLEKFYKNEKNKNDCFDRGRDKLLREVYYNLFREDQ
tara:strand:+ start:2426 stop:4558 length:2133 start_codon:yes stop_codon:yes gene_type:complete